MSDQDPTAPAPQNLVQLPRRRGRPRKAEQAATETSPGETMIDDLNPGDPSQEGGEEDRLRDQAEESARIAEEEAAKAERGRARVARRTRRDMEAHEYPVNHPTKCETLDIRERWPVVLDYLEYLRMGPEYVYIQMDRVPLTPYSNTSSKPDRLGAVDGDCVCGSAESPPGEDLINWIFLTYHRFAKGPCKYRCAVIFKGRPPPTEPHRQICRMDVDLPAPSEMEAYRRAEYEAKVQRRATIAANPVSAGMGSPMPMPPRMPGPAPMPILPAPIGVAPTDPMVMVVELLKVVVEKVSQPAAPPPPPPSLIDQVRLLTEVQKLVQPAALPAPKVETFDEQLEKLTKLQKALGMGQPAAAAPALAPAPAKAVVAPGPLESFKGALELVKQVDEFKATMGIGSGSDRDEDVRAPFQVYDIPGTDIKWPIANEGEELSTVDQAKGFAALNPELSFKMLGKVMEVVDQTTIGRLLRAMLEKGTPQQRAAAAHVVEVGLAAKPNGVSLPPSGVAPTVPAPPQPAAEWKPPV